MSLAFHRIFAAAVAVALLCGTALTAQAADKKTVARGKYLVALGGCNDCHTPGALHGPPDFSRTLGGSDVGFTVPGLGVFYGPNLTPDKDTGLGKWTKAQIITAMTQGKTPEGRELAPPMPWRALSQLTKADANAIASYLQSLPPIKNQVPGPFGPNQKPTALVLTIGPPAP